jgi:hypothetical protein
MACLNAISLLFVLIFGEKLSKRIRCDDVTSIVSSSKLVAETIAQWEFL